MKTHACGFCGFRGKVGTKLTDKDRIDYLAGQLASFRFIYSAPPYRPEWYSEEECLSDRSLRRLIDRIIARHKRRAVPGLRE